MKNKKILISIVFVIILLTTFVTIGFNYFYKDNKKESKKDFSDSTKISMFFETEINTGNYVEAVSSSWPTDGYIFNKNMSYCENDSTLKWQNNKIVVKAYVKDKCYVYFDKALTNYWNIFPSSSSAYISPNLPPNYYTSFEDMAANSGQFATVPLYIKTIVGMDNQVCLFYNNNEFCIGPNYWDTNAATTLNKLQADMETSLGTSASSCSGVGCTFGNNACYSTSNGQVYCETRKVLSSTRTEVPTFYVDSDGSAHYDYLVINTY